MRKKTLHQLFAEHTGKVSDRWSLYLTEYDRLFDDYRDKPVRLLEIGIQNGGSLELWSKYFSNASVLIGCDINPDCARLSYDDPRIGVIVGDVNAPDVRERVFQRSPQFDIIIDDGSHLSSDIIKSFALYFPRVVEGGVFIAEDLHCSYWDKFEGGLFDPYSSISFFKRLADVINHEHWGIPKARADILRGIFTKYDCEVDEEALSQVHSVEFINSMCVVRKATAADNGLGRRVIAGSMELVFPGLRKVPNPIFDQSSNPWTARTTPLDEAIQHTELALADRDRQIASLNQAVYDKDVHINNLSKILTELDGQIYNLNQTVVERDGQIASLNQAIQTLNEQVTERDAAVTERDGQIAAFYHSTSWRITWPLRIVGHQLKRSRRVAELATSGQIVPTPVSCEFDLNDYAEWIRCYDTLTDETRATMRARIDAFVHKPLISVVMPTYNPKPEWLIEAIESIRKQIYPCWELCIADDASTDKSVRPILERYAREDTRIKVVFREKNGHISASSNSALVLATGDWVALLDHDDFLAEHALFWVADAIDQNPDVCLIYSDEDKIDDSGRRFDPYFKCEWNVDLFYSHNLITHLGVYRAGLLNDIGGFREGLEGAQDYDLALRCVERLEPNQIYHIPRILYHWRAHAESTAKSGNAKPYALRAGAKALDEHFRRQGVNAIAELLDFGMYRIRYALPDPMPLVSLIIPTRNGLQLLRRCVESILEKTTYPNYEILLIDNASDDPAIFRYFKEIEAEARIRVVRDDRPFNFSALNNAAVKLARGEVVGLLNNDLEIISPEWLSEMVSHALRPEVGAVGARLWYPGNTLQHGGVVIGLGGVAGHSHKHLPQKMSGYFWRANLIQNYSAVTAACLVIRKSVYEEVGGLNEVNLQVAFNDVDFCLRVREAGYRNIWTPYAELYHHESATRGYEDRPEKQERFAKEVQYMKQRWGDTLLNDPAYSLNLTLDREDFSYAWPPRINLI
jgi:glycosyltransferase involved in cell wall biosynthesis